MKKANLPVAATICLMALAFGAFIVNSSVRNGQLSLPITYDDSGYFLDALQRLQLTHSHGIAAALQNYWAAPPHSPYSTLICFLAFVLFGVHSWAPAVLNIAFVVGFLFVCRRFAPDIPNLWFACVSIIVLTWPIMSFLVVESRPDFVCGGLTAVGALGIVQSRWIGSPWRHRCAMALLFASRCSRSQR